MPIPMPTTKVTLLAPRPTSGGEDWGTGADPETGFDPVASGIRAHFSTTGAGATTGQAAPSGATEVVRYELLCDPCDLKADMRVRDETTGLEYDVAWAIPRPEPMRHMVASVSRSTSTA